jgi:putative ABC transport system permease protein
MLKNYFKVALRNLFKNRIYSFINITGLALGMACCILILLWVQDELSFDSFHKNNDRLYKVVNQLDDGWITASPWALVPTLKKDFPEVDEATRFNTMDLLVKYNDKSFYENIGFVDPDFLEMFTFPLIEGDPSSALNQKESIIISEETAKKYFKNEDPVGKILQINNDKNYKITGVMKNIPSNSSLQFDMLAPIDYF